LSSKTAGIGDTAKWLRPLVKSVPASTSSA
jgi:hypothetical protein